jgi:glycosyltransferase involved in cell wall biosynthesis
MKKIVFDCERMKYPHTGLFHYCLNLAKAIGLQLDPGREKLIHYVGKKASGKLDADSYFMWQKGYHKFWFPDTSDIVLWHATYQNTSYFPDKGNLRKVLTIHDLNFLIEKQGRPDKIKSLLKSIQKKIDRSDEIICISQFTLSEVEKHLDIRSKSVNVIYNGCSINDNIPPVKPSSVSEGEFLFTIGTVTDKKNFHVLPALLVGNSFSLVIAGIHSNPGYVEKIISSARSLGVENRVNIIGPVSDAEKNWCFANCSAFVFPSLAEGFGLPVVEAMHYGKPIFLSDKTSLPEIGGDEAYYFSDFDPEQMRKVLEEGMKDYHMNHTKKDLIRERSVKFDWKTIADQHIQLYRKLL